MLKQARKEASNPASCPLCGGREHEERFSERGYKLLACSDCELLYIYPYLTDSDQIHSVISDYSYDEIEILEAKKHYQSEILFYKQGFSLISDECEGQKSLLDVGCGTGHLLERLSAYPNLQRVGIELNKSRAEMARKVSNCEIFQVPIEEFSTEIKFDVITLMNVLSHIPLFDDLFAAIHSLLRKEGKLLLKVGEVGPDVKSSSVYDWGIPDHRHFLGLKTIDHICRRYGFKILKHERIPFSQELFSVERWEMPGRSAVRNMLKRAVLKTPMMLPALARLYNLRHTDAMYSSFIVLTPVVLPETRAKAY